MNTCLILLSYLAAMLVTTRIMLWDQHRKGDPIDEDAYGCTLIAGAIWPVFALVGIGYLVWRYGLKPLVTPAAVRRAERERRQAQVDADLAGQAAELGLTYPTDETRRP